MQIIFLLQFFILFTIFSFFNRNGFNLLVYYSLYDIFWTGSNLIRKRWEKKENLGGICKDKSLSPPLPLPLTNPEPTSGRICYLPFQDTGIILKCLSTIFRKNFPRVTFVRYRYRLGCSATVDNKWIYVR